MKFDLSLPEFKYRGNVFHMHMPKMQKIPGTFEQQHKILKKYLATYESKIIERYQMLDHRLKNILFDETKQVYAILNCCQKTMPNQ